MEVRNFVDWVAATLPIDPMTDAGLKELAARITWSKPNEWTEAKPQHGYTYAVSHPDGYRAMAGRVDMGTHVILPGASLRGGKVGLLLAGGLLWSLCTRNAKFTRVDLAIDAIDSRLSILDLAEDFQHGDMFCASRKFSYVTSENRGQCLYIGSRTSERFARVYNKASELAVKGAKPEYDDWVRIELETKGETANHFGYMLHRISDPAYVVRTAISGFIDFPDSSTWREIAQGEHGDVSTSHRKLSDRQHWLIYQVARSIACEIQSDPTFARRFRRAIKAFLK